MTLEEYERERLRLEDQLRADIELLQAAHRTRLRALEALLRAEEPSELSPPVPLPPEPAPLPPLTPAPVSRRRKKGGAGELDDAVWEALERLEGEFTKQDLCQALGFTPSRTSLHRVLWRLENDGAIVTTKQGIGRRAGRYRKLESDSESP